MLEHFNKMILMLFVIVGSFFAFNYTWQELVAQDFRQYLVILGVSAGGMLVITYLNYRAANLSP